MFKIVFALLATLSFVISEAKAKDCLEVINPALLVKLCDPQGHHCFGSRTYRNVKKVEYLNRWTFGDSWPEFLKYVQQNDPGPTQYPPQPWQGWVETSQLDPLPVECAVIGFRHLQGHH
jgi:hypothetical protein